jgi:hypothetical protein
MGIRENLEENTLENEEIIEEWCLLGCGSCRNLQEPHGVTTQKTPFFIVTAVKTSNLTEEIIITRRGKGRQRQENVLKN